MAQNDTSKTAKSLITFSIEKDDNT